MPKIKDDCDPLAMLESLLSITEQFNNKMNSRDRKEWKRISAETADLRMIEEGGDPQYDV